jgi:hypothetical protein
MKSGDGLPTGGLGTGIVSTFTTGGGQVQQPASQMLNANTNQFDLFTTMLSIRKYSRRRSQLAGEYVREIRQQAGSYNWFAA